MKLRETTIPGLLLVESAPQHDARGYFHCLFDAEAFATAGIPFIARQSGLSHNTRAGTLRGLHYQAAPAAQAKLVRCLSGRLFDVAVDLRPGSPTFCRWFGVELSPAANRALFVPAGLAHGFLTLEASTDVLYELDPGEEASYAEGVRWNDPRFAITWPAPPAVINERDATYPDFMVR